jgi:hypothetical protein
MSEFTGLRGPSAFQNKPSKAAYIGATNLKSDYTGFWIGKPRKLGGALISPNDADGSAGGFADGPVLVLP